MSPDALSSPSMQRTPILSALDAAKIVAAWNRIEPFILSEDASTEARIAWEEWQDIILRLEGTDQ